MPDTYLLELRKELEKIQLKSFFSFKLNKIGFDSKNNIV